MEETYRKLPKVQGSSSIIINAPASLIWPLIKNSRELENWGPPVQKVEISLLPQQAEEGIGSKRKVYAKFSSKRQGWYEEVRTDQVENKSLTFIICKDNFGMDKLLYDVGGKMEIENIGENQCNFTFTFYHRPKNLAAWIINPIIRLDQKKNRLKALQSIKQYVENGKALKN